MGLRWLNLVGAIIGFAPRTSTANPVNKPADLPFARTGEIVTCENGHYICEIARDIYWRDRVRSANFKNWCGDPPEPGSKVDPCECGAFYLASSGQLRQSSVFRPVGHYLHIDGKWRPEIT